MKTILKLSVVVLFFFTTHNSMAQEKGDLRVFSGFSGMHLENRLGLAVGAEYFLAPKYSVSTNLLYSEGSTDNFTFESLISADVHYYLWKKRVNLYAYSGYGLYQVQGRSRNEFGIRNYHSTTFGAGMDYAVRENLGVYAQSKGWLNGDGTFHTFNLGVFFKLNFKKK